MMMMLSTRPMLSVPHNGQVWRMLVVYSFPPTAAALALRSATLVPTAATGRSRTTIAATLTIWASTAGLWTPTTAVATTVDLSASSALPSNSPLQDRTEQNPTLAAAYFGKKQGYRTYCFELKDLTNMSNNY